MIKKKFYIEFSLLFIFITHNEIKKFGSARKKIHTLPKNNNRSAFESTPIVYNCKIKLFS